MKKAVMFDLDGTLIHSLPDIADSMNWALRLCGLPPHPEEAYKLFTGDGAVNLAKRSVGENKPWQRVYDTYRAVYARNAQRKTAPYPGVADMLGALHRAGYQLLVLSNKDDSDVKAVVATYFPDIPFAKVQGKVEGYAVKPDPALGNKVLRELGLSGENLFYVGDTQTDMRCAHNLGATAIAVTYGFQTEDMLRQAKPHFFARSAEEIAAVIQGF